LKQFSIQIIENPMETWSRHCRELHRQNVVHTLLWRKTLGSFRDHSTDCTVHAKTC